MPRRSVPKPSDQYHHGDLRRALVDAALEIIERQGLEGLSLRAVARHANVSHTAPYHHFADRAGLMGAVAEEGFNALRTAIERRLSTVDDPRERLIESGVAYALFATRHPAHFRVMFSAELAEAVSSPTPSALREAAATAFEMLVGGIERGQSLGIVKEEDPREHARAAWSLMHGLAMLLLDGHLRSREKGETVEQIARRATETLWLGLST